MKRHERFAEKQFQKSLRAHVAAGIPARRGVSAAQYVAACTELWNRCETDAVYAVKLFIEPMIDTQFAEHSSDIFCVLIARCDPEGHLIDASPGYRRLEEPGIFLSKIVIGAPYGVSPRRPLKSKVETHLFAYFDILGFKNRLRKETIERVHQDYLRLIEYALKPQQAQWAKSSALSPGGPLVPALMRIPIEAAYASDSLVLYVPYHPSFVEEFLRRAALLFCVALRSRVPLRGAITFGQGAFHARTNVFIGAPLVEAAGLEQNLDWLGIVFGKSIEKLDWGNLPISVPEAGAVPLPPHLAQRISPPMKGPGTELFGGLVLDWPRVWRQTFDDSAIPYMAALYEVAEEDDSLQDAARDVIQARYEHAAYFFEFSNMNQNWCLPPGWRMITPDDLAANPLEGYDLSSLRRDVRYQSTRRGWSLRENLERLKSWTRSVAPVDPRVVRLDDDRARDLLY
jgi:hypothetical protein